MASAPDEALESRDVDANSERMGKVHERAMRRFDATAMPQQEQRMLSLAARRFVSIPGAQWEGDWGETWANSIKVEVNKVATGLEKIVRDYRENRIVPDFRPAGGDSDQDTADTLDGMHRADSYHFKAQQARDNAFEEAAAGGMGAYRLTNQWADPYDKDSDEQRINPGMTIVDADQRVFFDGNSKLYDKSDAEFCFVITAVTRAAFEEEHPDCATDWPVTIPKLHWDWFAPDIILKCEYYEVEDKDTNLFILTHVLTDEEQRWWSSDIDAEELAELEKQGWTKKARRQKRRRVHKYTMSGAEVLKDNGFIAGECIPVVPVYGKRWFIDNQERFRGYVQLKMDPQRLYNSNVSKLAETNALSPREKPIFLSEQMPDHLATQWANQEIDRHPYALVDPVIDSEGKYVAMGPIGKVEPPQLAPVQAALLQIAGNDLIEDQQDADEVVSNTSAEAMDLAATRIDAKSGIYLDNMRQSVQREGEIYLSMAKDIYYEEGRKVETMTEEGDDDEATLQEAVTDKNGYHRIRNDFSRGKYKVIADVTEATSTRRDKAVKSSLYIADIAMKAGAPDLAKAALITAVMNQDGEGTQDLQKFARRQGLAIGLVEPNEEEKKELEEAQGQQQPDANEQLAIAMAADKAASAKLKESQVQETGAKTVEHMASAALKGAQAQSLGADPTEAPDPLDQAERIAKIRKTAAETTRIHTEVEALPQELNIAAHKVANDRMKIRRGSETTH